MRMKFSMIVLEVRDLRRSIDFYRLLGLDMPEPAGRPVSRHRLDSGISLVLTQGFVPAADPAWVRPERGYQQLLEFFAGDQDAAVDAEWARLTRAGYHGRMAPRKTAGPYAAMVDDPDGNVILITSDAGVS